MPLIRFYCASKWAVEALHESFAQEVKAFGIKVTLLEPAAYATDFARDSSLKIATGLDAYADLRKRIHGQLSSADRGDPQATAKAILEIVDAEEPPLRFAVGAAALPMARAASLLAYPVGRHGRPSRTQHKASRRNAPSPDLRARITAFSRDRAQRLRALF